MKTITAVFRDQSMQVDMPLTAGCAELVADPLNMVGVSLSVSVGQQVVAYCQNHGLDPTGLQVTVSYDTIRHPPRLANFITNVDLPAADLTGHEGELELTIKNCPVAETFKFYRNMEVEFAPISQSEPV